MIISRYQLSFEKDCHLWFEHYLWFDFIWVWK